MTVKVTTGRSKAFIYFQLDIPEESSTSGEDIGHLDDVIMVN